MKKIALAGTTLALALVAASAVAAPAAAPASSTNTAGPNAGTMGVNLPFYTSNPLDFMINGKYFIAKDMAITAGIGFQMTDNGAPGAANQKSTDLGIAGGFRKYFPMNDFAPFVGGGLLYANMNNSNTNYTALMGEAGAEYFFSRHFSIEGSVGFGYIATKTTVAGNSTTATDIGTNSFNLSANFYF